MRTFSQIVSVIFVLLLCFAFSPHSAYGGSATSVAITEWQFRWETEDVGEPQDWAKAGVDRPLPDNPGKASSATIKIELPQPPSGTEWKQPGLFIDKLYGHHVRVTAGSRTIYESSRHYTYDVYKIALPLERADLGASLTIRIDTLSDRIGIHKKIDLGEYADRLSEFYKTDLLDLVLGGSLVFFGAIMLVCTSFLKKSHLVRWLSLSLVIMSTGVLIATYTPLPYTYYAAYGKLWLTLFDLSLFVFLPALAVFVEKALDTRNKVVTTARSFTIGYSVFCIALLAANLATHSRYIKIYYFFTLSVLGIIMIFLFVILIGSTIAHALKGNKDAIILSTGFALFAITAVGELSWFYAYNKNYELFFWKWGVLCFVIAFIVILARGFARDHEQVVLYSRELELYNNRLQRHEKMEIISELAASVAHEVRNPLQVTRGFLQLLRETAEGKPKKYLGFAMDELDRASEIITDFLTFAKPQLDDVTILCLADEFEHIEGILAPMANIQGGEIRVRLPGELFIRGNSSKLKQAFVNIVKNSIEALEGEGIVEIWAYRERDEVVIHIKDNGTGMDENELSRLGEPYFSSKSKGTGLGLMVTFRIIEVMQGKIEFKSVKGVGTEAIVRFPAVLAD
ncbi:ATP-binding protein [Paenibacillus sp. GYB003]|uniref:ATP-binding protein n=1 Tax=Paenibacillus sp. GYB003 TaxID=2994392 RepID=UPI002F96B603